MKRAIALFLALVFVFGLIPVSALADDTVTLTVEWLATDTTGFKTRPVEVTAANKGQSADSLSETVKEIKITADKYDTNGALFVEWDIASTPPVADGGTYQVENGGVDLPVPVTAVYEQRVEVTLANATFTTPGIEGRTYHAFEGGDAIKIKANTAPAGKTFKGWAINPTSNGVSYLGLASMPTDAEFSGAATLLSDKGGKVSVSAVYSDTSYSANFDTSGVAVSLNELDLDNDDFEVESPLTVPTGSKVYVRFAKRSSNNAPMPDREVTGAAYNLLDDDDEVISSTDLTFEEDGDDYTIYSFMMPDGNISIYASYEYKITLGGATGKLSPSTTSASEWWVAPGTRYTITLDADSSLRNVESWSFSPALPTATQSATSDKVTYGDVGTQPSELKRTATFTMPNQALAIGITYDRELAQSALTVVNATAKVTPVGQDEQTVTSPATVKEGSSVKLTAVCPPEMTGMQFKKWVAEGDAEFVAAINAGTKSGDNELTFRMPKVGGTVTAQYQGTYTLTTEGASGYSVAGVTESGDANGVKVFYGEEVIVTTAKTAYKWKYSPSTLDDATENATAKTTTFTVDSNSGIEALTVAAKGTFALTVNDGSSPTETPIAVGDTVTIIADTPTAGKGFKKWETASDGVMFADANASTTTFVMPGNDVTVTASFGVTHEIRTIGQKNDDNLCARIGVAGDAATSNVVVAAKGKALTATARETGVFTEGSTVKNVAFENWVAKAVNTDGTWGKEYTLPDKNNSVMNFDVPTDLTDGQKLFLYAVYSSEYADVTVTNGTGSGKYFSGDTVTIAADAKAGQEFVHWTFTYMDPTASTPKALTTEVTSSSYTFTIGTDVGIGPVTAEAVYTALPKLTLQSANASAAGDLTMTLGTQSISSEAGKSSVSGYWHTNDAISITTKETVSGADGSTLRFSRWVLISGDAVITNATSASTTVTVHTADAVIAAKYGDELLLTYKTAERDGVHLYDNWEYAYKKAGDSVQLTAEDPDNTFVGWEVPASLAHTVSGAKNRVLSFAMPADDVKVYPVYTHELLVADNAEYSVNGGTWTMGTGEPVAVQTGALVALRPIEDFVGTGTTGRKLFKSWRTNTSIINSGVKNNSFIMPPEDIEAAVIYQTYTLTVIRTVSGTKETYALHPGEYITLSSEEASGGRCFNYWTHTDGLTFTVKDEKFDEKDSSRLVSQRITVQMPEKDAYIYGWFELYPRYDYWNTDAFIRVEGEPKRYYALLEYFQPWDMKVIYYAGLTGKGVEVDRSDYVMQIVKAGTDEVATANDFCFTQAGAFDIIVTMIVSGRQMAPSIRVMDQPSTHLYCTATRAEYTQSFTKPNRTEYYEGEEVVKDGLDVLLRSADHTDGVLRYSTVRELDESEYKLKPWGTGWDADGHTNAKLPTQEEIFTKWKAGQYGYKFENGRYYVCMEVTDCFDYTQLNSDGSYMRMEYIVNDAKDYIWVEVKKPASNITLAPENEGPDDEVNNVPNVTSPMVSWVIKTDLAQSNIRQLRVNVDGFDSDMDKAAAVEYTNSDSTVAYLEPTSNPLVYNVKIKSTGVTTIRFRALGDPDVYADCEITVETDAALQPITEFEWNGLNHDRINLYVGTDIALRPEKYGPSGADTTCNWYVEFSDGLLPQNAEYYVSVSEAGVVEVLKYTERPVRVWALPSNPAGQNTLDKAHEREKTGTVNGCLYAYCDITVLQIPVDNMTLYPAAMTLYRLATKNLKVTLYPEAASDKNIRWTSTDSSVASVDNNGNVTANKLGTAKITATSESNPLIYQTCTVTVAQSVLLTGLTLNRTSATLGIEDTMVLTPYYTPATATTQSVIWTSNATTVATVDSNGKVRGLSEGVAVITATAIDGSGKQVSCVVSVSTIVSSAVVLNKQTLALVEDDSETLVATVYPTNVSNAKVNWTSSNDKVATVDPDGVVTATGGGSAVITATAKDASTKYADCVVAVTAKIPVTALTLNLGNFDMLLNDTTILKPTVAPTNATAKLTWSSSNPAVASVDENGKVSARATGDAVITCKAGDMIRAITVSVVTKTFSTGKVVNCTRRVNVRAKASGTSTILGYAYLGDVYKVLDKSTNWYKIQYNAGTIAYIWSRYLSATETGAGYVSAGKVGSTTTDTTGTTGTTTPVPVVTAKTLTIANCTYCVNVRSGAGTTFSRLGYAYLDEAFTYTGTQGDWYIITYNGANAYVSSQFVKVN